MYVINAELEKGKDLNLRIQRQGMTYKWKTKGTSFIELKAR